MDVRDPDKRIKELGFSLPPVPDKAGLYKLVNVVGTRCTVCGHGPLARQKDGTFSLQQGRVGESVTVRDAKEAARLTAICMLASLQSELGSLGRISRLVRTLGLVNADRSCVDHLPKIIDGFSEVMRDVFGPVAGVGARSAVGAGTLPFNIPVEVEAEFELKPAAVVELQTPRQGNIYERKFGLPGIINCIGSFTSLGGSRMADATAQAMVEASKHFVDLNGLQRACGRRLAELCRCPPGYGAFLTTGASAALAVSTAACIAGTDAEIIRRLPRVLPSDKYIVIMDGGNDTRWAQSIATTGAKIRLLGNAQRPMTAEQLEDELSGADRGRHAGIVFYDQILPADVAMSLDTVQRLSQKYRVPLIVDAAAQVPPRSNLWHWTSRGVDVVIFSGGKQLSGPQTSGMILARDELIDAMRLNTSPNENTVCRPMKCSKEDMVALVTAVEIYMQGSDEEEFAHYKEVLNVVSRGVKNTPGMLSAHVLKNPDGTIQPACIPRLQLALAMDEREGAAAVAASNAAGFARLMKDDIDHGNPLQVKPTTPSKTLAYRLIHGKPCIAINTTAKGLIINPQLLTLDEARIVCKRIDEECREMVKSGQLMETVHTSRL